MSPILGIIASGRQTDVSFMSYVDVLSTGRFNDCIVNSDGIYLTGRSNSTARIFTVRLNFNGTINWQRELYATSGTNEGFGVTVDSAGNVYITGQYWFDSTSATETFLAKYNSSGTLQYQKRIDSGAASEYAESVISNSSDELFIVGNRTGVSQPLVRELTTTPTTSWCKDYTFPAGDISGGGVAGITLDSSGNIYPLANYNLNSGKYSYARGWISKFNSSGTRQGTNRSLGSSTAGGPNHSVTGIASGSNRTYSNDIYVAGYYDNTSNAITKLDTSLAVQWTRSIDTDGTPGAITVSAAGDVYVLTEQFVANDARIVILKYNSSGTLQWQRRIDGNTGNNSQSGESIKVDEARQRLVVAGRFNNEPFVAFLPMDGSGTGTYTLSSFTITYDTPTFTSTTITPTTTSSSLSTTNTRTDTYTDSTMTAATPTYTASTVTF